MTNVDLIISTPVLGTFIFRSGMMDDCIKDQYVISLDCGHEFQTEVKLRSDWNNHYVLCPHCVNGKEEFLDKVERGIGVIKPTPLCWTNVLKQERLNDLPNVQSQYARIMCKSILRLSPIGTRPNLFPYCPRRKRATFS